MGACLRSHTPCLAAQGLPHHRRRLLFEQEYPLKALCGAVLAIISMVAYTHFNLRERSQAKRGRPVAPQIAAETLPPYPTPTVGTPLVAGRQARQHAWAGLHDAGGRCTTGPLPVARSSEHLRTLQRSRSRFRTRPSGDNRRAGSSAPAPAPMHIHQLYDYSCRIQITVLRTVRSYIGIV